MKIKFFKTIKYEGSVQSILIRVQDIILNRNAKSAKLNDDSIEFETKNIFSYFNFHLFSYIDNGRFLIDNNTHKSQVNIKYELISYRIWFVALIGFILSFFAFESFLASLIITTFIWCVVYFFLRVAHSLFFKKLIKRITFN